MYVLYTISKRVSQIEMRLLHLNFLILIDSNLSVFRNSEPFLLNFRFKIPK